MTAKTYDRQTGKFLARVAENMPEMSGEVMQSWINDPKSLQNFLKGLIPSANRTTTQPEFKVWKTIKLGTGLKTAEDFRKALKKGGHKIGDWGNDILGKPAFTASETEIEVELVVASVAELGFKDGATRKDIYERALSYGLELCPNEVGPQLRLQYEDQPNGEWLLVAMEPIADSDGRLHVFGVARVSHGSWLYGDYGYPVHFWHGHRRWVFLRRKQFQVLCTFGLL